MSNTVVTIGSNLMPVFLTIEECVKNKRIQPALMLLYSTIDILASLGRREGEGTRKAFERWVLTYMLPAPGLERCRPVDLYAARCGILHTLTADADLIKRGEAVSTLYAWGTAEASKLQEASDRLGRKGVALHLDALRIAVAKGAGKFFTSLDSDGEARELAEQAARAWFAHLEVDTLDTYLGRTSLGA